MWKACAPVNKELARLAQETETWIVHHPLSLTGLSCVNSPTMSAWIPPNGFAPQFFIPRVISICMWLTTSKILRLDIEASSQIKQFMSLAFSETILFETHLLTTCSQGSCFFLVCKTSGQWMHAHHFWFLRFHLNKWSPRSFPISSALYIFP